MVRNNKDNSNAFEKFWKFFVIFLSVVGTTILCTLSTLSYIEKTVKKSVQEALIAFKIECGDLKNGQINITDIQQKQEKLLSNYNKRINNFNRILDDVVNHINKRDNVEFDRPKGLSTLDDLEYEKAN